MGRRFAWLPHSLLAVMLGATAATALADPILFPMLKKFRGEHLTLSQQRRAGIQCSLANVLYLRTPTQQARYEVSVTGGLLVDRDGIPFSSFLADYASMYVISRDTRLLASPFHGRIMANGTQTASFQHSSLVAGDDVPGAGRFVAVQGILIAADSETGHYVVPENVGLQHFRNHLEKRGYDTSQVYWGARAVDTAVAILWSQGPEELLRQFRRRRTLHAKCRVLVLRPGQVE